MDLSITLFDGSHSQFVPKFLKKRRKTTTKKGSGLSAEFEYRFEVKDIKPKKTKAVTACGVLMGDQHTNRR